MIHFMFRRRFNFFDCLYLFPSTALLAHGHYIIGIAVILLGAIPSVVGETVLENRSGQRA